MSFIVTLPFNFNFHAAVLTSLLKDKVWAVFFFFFFEARCLLWQHVLFFVKTTAALTLSHSPGTWTRQRWQFSAKRKVLLNTEAYYSIIIINSIIINNMTGQLCSVRNVLIYNFQVDTVLYLWQLCGGHSNKTVEAKLGSANEQSAANRDLNHNHCEPTDSRIRGLKNTLFPLHLKKKTS